jgi:hypothetical protein
MTGTSQAEYKARQRRVSRSIDRIKIQNPDLRKKLEADPEAWLMHYCGTHMFPYAFSEGHKAIIRETIEAAKTGTGAAIAAPRGEGKTTVLRGVAVGVKNRVDRLKAIGNGQVPRVAELAWQILNGGDETP